MNIIIKDIQTELDNYLNILSDTNSIYYVSPQNAYKKLEDLQQIITNLGNNPNMSGTYVCPWKRLGQKVNRKKTGPQYP